MISQSQNSEMPPLSWEDLKSMLSTPSLLPLEINPLSGVRSFNFEADYNQKNCNKVFAFVSVSNHSFSGSESFVIPAPM